MAPLFKVKTRRGKRALLDRDPKTIENDKTALLVKGGKTNQVVTDVLKDLYLLKKPLATQLKRRNPFHPFEDETPLERFSNKLDTSLFLFASNSKKHPNSLVFGRMHDGQLLDMVELRVTSFKASWEFDVPKMTLGSKPCLIFEGAEFESDPSMKRVGNLLVDWFRGPVVEQIRQNIYMRTYRSNILDPFHEPPKTMDLVSFNSGKLRIRTILKKSATATPRVELVEMGPSIDFLVDRNKLADDSLFKQACRRPKALLAKRRKNTSEDVFGNQLARIHIGKQNTDAIQTRKVKALRKGDPKAATEAENDDGEDDGGEE